MCGIAGICSLSDEPVRPAEILKQIDSIVYRGPDEGDIYVSAGFKCGLGIRRLSIIDVMGGQQPLCNEDNSVRLVYNGETYNYRELRNELEALGHVPKTHSDAEAILHGYEAWGEKKLLRKLRGIFAFALWDEKRQRLFVARDRFGIKPLYYAQHGGRLYLGSEIKTILTEAAFPRRVDLSALQAMLTLGFVPGPATMFEGVYKLPPAHYLTVQNETINLEEYWSLEYQELQQISEQEATEQFLALLQESVRLRLMSEVPLGALLSGGLDSATVVALVQANSPRRLKTVSIGFETAEYDESSLAESLAQRLGTEHHPVTFSTGDFDIYPRVMVHLEEPQCSATALPIYRLYQACRSIDLTVVLTGEGADELLGGYHWHKGDALVRSLLSMPQSWRSLVADSPLPMSTAARRVLRRGTREISERYRDWLEVSDRGYRPRILSDEAKAALGPNGRNPLLVNWAEKLVDLKTNSVLNQTLWLEAQTRLVDFINFEVDRMSMASSIEARVPFLDHKLWEFCATLPSDYKLRKRTEKYLLRLATKGLLPEATRTRQKKGLAAPYARWLQSKPLPEWAETALSDTALRQTGLFDPEVVTDIRHLHQAGRLDLGSLLMGVLSTQVWFECFFKK
jgi:asparagine synthase (glutamine-hydrolysing)